MTTDQPAPNDALDPVCAAIAHPLRRAVLTRLAASGGRLTAGEIARGFDCAWPTTTRHLRILEAAGLVAVEPRGRERVYVLQPERLIGALGPWLRRFTPDIAPARPSGVAARVASGRIVAPRAASGGVARTTVPRPSVTHRIARHLQ